MAYLAIFSFYFFIGYLWKPDETYDIFSITFAELGALFSLIAIGQWLYLDSVNLLGTPITNLGRKNYFYFNFVFKSRLWAIPSVTLLSR